MKIRFAVEIELNDEQEDLHPDTEDCVLQIERALTEAKEEYGIINAFAVPVEGDWRVVIQQALNNRRKEAK